MAGGEEDTRLNRLQFTVVITWCLFVSLLHVLKIKGMFTFISSLIVCSVTVWLLSYMKQQCTVDWTNLFTQLTSQTSSRNHS